jgi:hypothetical protein
MRTKTTAAGRGPLTARKINSTLCSPTTPKKQASWVSSFFGSSSLPPVAWTASVPSACRVPTGSGLPSSAVRQGLTSDARTQKSKPAHAVETKQSTSMPFFAPSRLKTLLVGDSVSSQTMTMTPDQQTKIGLPPYNNMDLTTDDDVAQPHAPLAKALAAASVSASAASAASASCSPVSAATATATTTTPTATGSKAVPVSEKDKAMAQALLEMDMPHYYLLFSNGQHFEPIIRINSLVGSRKFCDACCKGTLWQLLLVGSVGVKLMVFLSLAQDTTRTITTAV